MITREFTAYIKRAAGQDVHIPVSVRFAYDPDRDPLAVQAVFRVDEEEDRVWDFGWELLSEGVRSVSPHGRGDVKFRYFPMAAAVLMCLKSPEGHVDIALPLSEVGGFLHDTRKAFEEASQDCTAMVDDFLKEVLGQ